MALLLFYENNMRKIKPFLVTFFRSIILQNRRFQKRIFSFLIAIFDFPFSCAKAVNFFYPSEATNPPEAASRNRVY